MATSSSTLISQLQWMWEQWAKEYLKKQLSWKTLTADQQKKLVDIYLQSFGNPTNTVTSTTTKPLIPSGIPEQPNEVARGVLPDNNINIIYWDGTSKVFTNPNLWGSTAPVTTLVTNPTATTATQSTNFVPSGIPQQTNEVARAVVWNQIEIKYDDGTTKFFDNPNAITFTDSGSTINFTPNTTRNGVNINTAGTNDQQRFGITSAQRTALNSYINKLNKSGSSSQQVNDLGIAYLKQLQANNLNPNTFGSHSGSNPVNISTDPTLAQNSIENKLDLNNNGIPDSQELGTVTKATQTITTPWFEKFWKSYNVDVTNFNDVEKTFLQYQQDLTQYEQNLQKKFQDTYSQVKNASAQNVINLNNKRVDEINNLLDETIANNRTQYENAVGDVYRQLWGNVKQFQRIIGSDWKAIDDATMLSLMGWVGVDAMWKVIDLKNQLAQQLLAQKDVAQQNIYKLQSNNVLTQNETNEALAALDVQTQQNILNLTKTFYEKMFGLSDTVQQRTESNQAATQNAINAYLTQLGLTPQQQASLLAPYSTAGYTPSEAINKLSQDITNGTNDVLKFFEQNNEAASAAAKAEFEQKLAIINAQTIADLTLQQDKQAFTASETDKKIRADENLANINNAARTYIASINATADANDDISDATYRTFVEDMTKAWITVKQWKISSTDFVNATTLLNNLQAWIDVYNDPIYADVADRIFSERPTAEEATNWMQDVTL